MDEPGGEVLSLIGLQAVQRRLASCHGSVAAGRSVLADSPAQNRARLIRASGGSARNEQEASSFSQA